MSDKHYPNYEDYNVLLNELLLAVSEVLVFRPNGTHDLSRTKAEFLATAYDSCKKRRDFIEVIENG